MYSDNGSKFVGADNLFETLDWDRIVAFATVNRIQWRFNPPTAAWLGGWWERLVRMVKQLLRRVLGRTSLNYEELMTILCDCESIINSRPLAYVSEDSSDLVPLTPAMFLQEVRVIGVPEMDELDSNSANRKLRYRQRLRNDLRQRFRVEYLGQLVQRTGEKGNQHEISIGDIVLVGSDNVKRLDWPMAKVIEVHPGKDNAVRVVKLKTSKGELVRPIQRVFPLELTAKGDETLNLKVMKTKKDKFDSNKPSSAMNPEPVKVVTRFGRQVKAASKYSS